MQLQLQMSYLMYARLVSFVLFVVCIRPTQPYSCSYGKLKGLIGTFPFTGGGKVRNVRRVGFPTIYLHMLVIWTPWTTQLTP